MFDLAEARRYFARAPFITDLGVEPTAIGPGSLNSNLPLQPRHFQHTGQVHAGVMGTMADHTMGIAAQTLALKASATMALVDTTRKPRDA